MQTDDDALLSQWLDGSLPFEQWTHAAHLRVAFQLAREHEESWGRLTRWAEGDPPDTPDPLSLVDLRLPRATLQRAAAARRSGPVPGGHLEVGKWLVESGAAIDQPNNAGETPLHECAAKGA